MKIFRDILFSYLYPFRSVKDMKGSGWGIFYGLSPDLMGPVDKKRHRWKEALSCHAPGDSFPKWEAQRDHILEDDL